MPIDKSLTYETHRPQSPQPEVHLRATRASMSEDVFKTFDAARRRAVDTGGPIMVGTPGDMRPATMRGADVDQLYTQALKGGANPCYVDEETGQVHLGHFIFVPLRDTN